MVPVPVTKPEESLWGSLYANFIHDPLYIDSGCMVSRLPVVATPRCVHDEHISICFPAKTLTVGYLLLNSLWNYSTNGFDPAPLRGNPV